NVVGNLRKTLSLFLQAVPEDVSVEELERRIVSIKKVRTTHHTHVWSLDGLNHVLTCHVVVEDDTAPSDVIQIKRDIAQLCKELPLEHTTFEIEYESEACGMRAG
ncbi:MAG: cation transporter, partial [Anaerolineae bacterium]|nr:cation transporter [Anaerolineae bacterium]NIN94928.1 cation transporter [Anaerolineae bacterium]